MCKRAGWISTPNRNFDKDGNLTSDPGAIEASRRILPTGYWKGSGMAIALDLAAGKMDTRDIASVCILDKMKAEEAAQ